MFGCGYPVSWNGQFALKVIFSASGIDLGTDCADKIKKCIEVLMEQKKIQGV
jgi:hypothetical protein